MTSPIACEFALVPLDRLREHEEVVSDLTVKSLAERIRVDGFMYQPICADAKTLTVLDGHHRLHALRLLRARLAPVNLVDYEDPRIVVETWREGETPPSKRDVVAHAVAGTPFPPKSTRHPALYDLPTRRVSLDELL